MNRIAGSPFALVYAIMPSNLLTERMAQHLGRVGTLHVSHRAALAVYTHLEVQQGNVVPCEAEQCPDPGRRS